MPRPTTAQKRATFKALHQEGCFALPNPWDVGSARMLENMGFKALASTSAGLAWSLGRWDNSLTRADVLGHLATLCAGTDLPINADFEGGFADTPEGVAESVRMAVATGVAGLSIEDSTGNADAPVRDLADAVARMRAARAAIDAAGGDTLLVGRAENFLVGRPDLDDTITRLKAYSEAGADCLYAPFIKDPAHIRAIVQAVAPKPVNLLIGWGTEQTLADFAALGVRRVSIGGALARAAMAGFYNAAVPLAKDGSFAGLAVNAPGMDLNGGFKQWAKEHAA